MTEEKPLTNPEPQGYTKNSDLVARPNLDQQEVAQKTVDLLNELIERARTLLSSPKYSKSLDLPKTLQAIAEIMKAMKSAGPNVFPKSLVVNMNQVKELTDDINSTPYRRKELRAAIRTELKRKPS